MNLLQSEAEAKAVKLLSNLGRTFRLIFEAAPALAPAWGLVLLFQGLLPVAAVYLTRRLVDGLVNAIQAGGSWDSLQPVLIPAVLMAGVLLLTEALNGAAEWARTALAELTQDHLMDQVHRKAAAVDLAYYESSDFQDRLYRATTDSSSRPLALLDSTGGLIQNGLTLAGMAAVLLPYGAWLPLALFASTLPALWVVLVTNRRSHQWWERTTHLRRRVQYNSIMLTHGAPAAEVRLFDLGEHFRAAYEDLRRTLRRERLELVRGQSLARLGAGALALLISGLALLWFVHRAILGLLTLGDLALLYQAFNRGQSLLGTLLSNAGQIHTSTLFLGNLFEFLDLKPQLAESQRPLPAPERLAHGIRFRKVTFRYPGSERPALQDFDLSLPAGKITAIVGPNGAGKSTLFKLLCRFYDPQSGSIELDGIDLRRFSIAGLRRRITVLFQDPMEYQDPVSLNIALGDLKAGFTPAEIETAARRSGAHELIARLPGGYGTVLGKWYADGVELSGGEWQRLALARAFIRQTPVIALDEPTSFMDSWAEQEWYENFRALAQGRTALLITHRFSVAMRADLIYVMDRGRIVEAGTHAELAASGGLYAQSWSAQMRAGERSAGRPAGPQPVLAPFEAGRAQAAD